MSSHALLLTLTILFLTHLPSTTATPTYTNSTASTNASSTYHIPSFLLPPTTPEPVPPHPPPPASSCGCKNRKTVTVYEPIPTSSCINRTITKTIYPGTGAPSGTGYRGSSPEANATYHSPLLPTTSGEVVVTSADAPTVTFLEPVETTSIAEKSPSDALPTPEAGGEPPAPPVVGPSPTAPEEPLFSAGATGYFESEGWRWNVGVALVVGLMAVRM